MKKSITAVLCVMAFLFGMQEVMAHPGGLDSRGGHRNRKTGEYHKHRTVTEKKPKRNDTPTTKPRGSDPEKILLRQGVARLQRANKELREENARLREAKKAEESTTKNPQRTADSQYEGIVESHKQIYDGDTIQDVRVKIADFYTRGEVWPGILITDEGIFSTADLRLAGIDTPEKRGSSDSEKKLAAEARARLVIAVMDYANGRIRVKNPKLGKWAGRVVCEVWVRINGRDINVSKWMLNTGLAKPYDGGKRPVW